MKKVYVLIEEDNFYDNDIVKVSVFKSKKRAVKELKKLRDNFIDNNYVEDKYTIDMDTEDEFDCFMTDFYSSNRYILSIQEENVVEEDSYKSRFEILLQNAIICMEENKIFDTKDVMLEYLGMTEDEYNDIMGE